MLNEKKILDKILMNEDIFDRGFKLKKLKLMKHIQNIFWIINKNILNGLLNYGAPDRSRTHNLRSRNPALYPVEATGAFFTL